MNYESWRKRNIWDDAYTWIAHRDAENIYWRNYHGLSLKVGEIIRTGFSFKSYVKKEMPQPSVFNCQRIKIKGFHELGVGIAVARQVVEDEFDYEATAAYWGWDEMPDIVAEYRSDEEVKERQEYRKSPRYTVGFIFPPSCFIEYRI